MRFSDPDTSPAATLPTRPRDYPDWHHGRARYGLWAVLVEQPALIAYVRAIRRELADLLHPCPQRQVHLTVFVCGFESAVAARDDDFPPERLALQIARLEALAPVARALALGRPDSFASAAFVPVVDADGWLPRIRAALGSASREIRQAAYVPHLTLGLYRRRVDAATLRARLAALDPPPAPLRVRRLDYVTYAARSFAGPLASHYRFALSGL